MDWGGGAMGEREGGIGGRREGGREGGKKRYGSELESNRRKRA